MNEPIAQNIIIIMYIGDALFAMSGALTAGKHRMDILGYVMIGVITGIGGGTLRDLLLGRTVWWTKDPFELILCLTAALVAYFFIGNRNVTYRGLQWLDALGLSSFAVVGTHTALEFGSPFIIAVFMGMVTSTGGGVIRDILTDTKPMIFSQGEFYATAALGGAFIYALTLQLPINPVIPQFLGCTTVLFLRAMSIIFGLQIGLPGQKLFSFKSKKSKEN